MKLDIQEKKRLCRLFIYNFNNNNEWEDVLAELETNIPKRIDKKLRGNGDVDDVGSPSYIYDKHATKLIKKVYTEFPIFIRKCIMDIHVIKKHTESKHGNK